ncbi:ATP-binding cassette domain-containing protein [Skermania sp. ID1734]|uniref:ABC transporter ATP-binding protein n=1 Tax=Skermania sp. ID1734 TaxID=2597516 RepID=UPI00117E649F|nr:ATP-binding cassette domain-containing protein [Skermania sp. ID1734]TSE01888.1 ATP-binding cassette domain-containing protein [Skermania sp. ID1734]
MIEFVGVGKRYPDGTVAVDNLDLRIESGQFTVFVGPSGCGKTTSMRMINRMIEPTSGAVKVDGRDVADADPVRLRRGIGYVIQSGGLLPHRTVVDNVATVPVLNGMSRKAARHAALDVLERVGLDTALAKRYPAQLSGGQQQRVGVARALAADPPILLLDEPFSAVDPVVREELQAEMQRLQAQLHKTIVFVTHDIDEAVKLGDKLAVFGPGGVLQQYDSPQQVLTSPATAFVADFVGRDRGYRGLSFRSAEGLTLRPLIIAKQDGLADVRLAHGEWALVVDSAGAPHGWVDWAGNRFAGGSVFRRGGDLRQALDSAISSPSGLGIAVDENGTVIGGFDAGDVIALLTDLRRRDQR